MNPLLKCDSAAREALERGSQERMSVLVRVHGVAEAVRGELEASGLEVHSTTGPIASGEILATRLSALVDLGCVRRVELSRQLYPER